VAYSHLNPGDVNGRHDLPPSVFLVNLTRIVGPISSREVEEPGKMLAAVPSKKDPGGDAVVIPVRNDIKVKSI
jgi:hypothetical protein